MEYLTLKKFTEKLFKYKILYAIISCEHLISELVKQLPRKEQNQNYQYKTIFDDQSCLLAKENKTLEVL